MTYAYIACVVLTVCVFCTHILAETDSNVKDLLTELYTTRGYNKKIRPVSDQVKPLNISMDFYLNSVIDFDEKTESLKTSGYLSIIWIDELMKWTASDFNNTPFVFLPQDDVWKPDVALQNSFKSFTGLGSSFLNLQLSSDGIVRWNPYQVLESTCAVSITYFPFDEQKCELKFTAWSYSKEQVEINEGSKGVILADYVPNASWEVLDTSAEEINSDEAAVIFTIKLKRKPRFYIINIIIPVIFLSILNMFSFVIPVVSGERAGYSITVFLSLAVFLTIVSDQLPKNSEHTSYMAVYLMLITGLSTGIVMVCMTQLRLQSWHETPRPVSKFYKSFVTVHNCLRCRKLKNQSVAPNDEMSAPSDLNGDTKSISLSDDTVTEQSRVTWLDVINAMDFIFFIISTLYTFICTLVIGIVSVHGGN